MAVINILAFVSIPTVEVTILAVAVIGTDIPLDNAPTVEVVKAAAAVICILSDAGG